MADLSLGNVFEVSVSAPGASVGEYNTSNLAVISHEAAANSFGSLGYKIYVDPTEVQTDFGSASITYKLALGVFSQQPNIRANGGYLVIFKTLESKQSLSFSGTPTAGQFVLNVNGINTAPILFSDNAAAVQAKIVAAGFPGALVTGSYAAGFTVDLIGVYNAPLLSTSGNTLVATATPVVITPAITQAAETMAEAITRADALVHFFGVIFTVELVQAQLLAAAAVLLPMRKIGGFLGSLAADAAPNGKLDQLTTGGFTNSRGILRTLSGSQTVTDGLVQVASYFGRGLSVDFSGSNTTITMHLKDLKGVNPDLGITQTILNQCKASGADLYASFRGVAKTYTSGANDFFDNVYNILWFVEATQVAGFNVFGTTPTKIPQTEGGMDVLKGSVRRVCDAAVTNGFCAPGEWTSPVTFGPQADFFDNIRQRGYYIWSAPIATQSVADREARKMRLIQVALKYAGAGHSGNLIVNINE